MPAYALLAYTTYQLLFGTFQICRKLLDEGWTEQINYYMVFFVGLTLGTIGTYVKSVTRKVVSLPGYKIIPV